MNVSEYIWSRIPELTGSRHVFTLSGGGCMHLTDALGRSGLIPVPMHHEQAAAFAAMAYGRANNCIGVCLVTSGPGGTNAITGVAAAWMDSVPMLVISGNVSSNFVARNGDRQNGFQEFNIVKVVESFTKKAVYLNDSMPLIGVLEDAVDIARSGRPGPVWIDIPLDMQASSGEMYRMGNKLVRESPIATSGAIYGVRDALIGAKRPLILLGGGVVTGGAVNEARELVNKLHIPVQTSWNAIDVIPADYGYWYGRPSFYGPRYSNFIIQNADYILAIGTRLGVLNTGWAADKFAPKARIAIVNSDANYDSDYGRRKNYANTDAKSFISALSDAVSTATFAIRDAATEWIDYCNLMRSTYPVAPPSLDDNYVDPYRFYDKLSEHLAEDATVVIGSSGTAFSVGGQAFRSKAAQRVFTSKGMAAMGTGLPSVIGAHFARPGKQLVTIIGDGGLQLNIQELQTIRHHNIPAKIFVLNNGGYNAIQTTQKTNFEGRFVGAGPSSGVSFPNLEQVADTYGMSLVTIFRNKNLDEGLNSAFGDSLKDHPTLIEVMLDPDKPLLPKAGSKILQDGTFESLPLEDLYPLLPRDEYERNMICRNK